MLVNLKWWFIFCLSLVATATCGMLGLLKTLWVVDITHLGIAMIALYFGASAFIGFLTYQGNYGRDAYVKAHLGPCWYVAELFLALGMIGTMIGFIVMIRAAFGPDVDINNLKVVITNAASGLSTACITTLIGLICSYALKAQLVNLEMLLPDEA